MKRKGLTIVLAALVFAAGIIGATGLGKIAGSCDLTGTGKLAGANILTGKNGLTVASLKASAKDSNNKNKKDKKDNKKSEDAESLAQRMVGKYYWSYGENPDSDEPAECLVMNVITFGDNLYAFCGNAYEDDPDHIESYSYFAMELIPFDTDDLTSTESDSVEINELIFSNMSNIDKYWNSGWPGTVTLTDEGLLFEDFEDFDFLCGSDGESRLFEKDDRVEDIFPYLNPESESGEKKLQGLWMTDDEYPLFIEFNGSNMTIYQKEAGAEVLYEMGGCEFTKGGFSFMGNRLGYGTMPFDTEAEYEISGKTLKIEFDDNVSEALSGELTLEKADVTDIPVITMDDVEFDEDSFGAWGGPKKCNLPDDEEYYGVFIASFKKPEQCEKTEMKLEDAGFHLCPTIYTPDFSDLNPEPYYVVTGGLFTDKKEAEDTLKEIKKAGFSDAYVKKAGSYIGETYWYIMDGAEDIEVLRDRFVVHDVLVSIPYMVDEGSCVTDIVIDKSTEFDKSAETEYFGNYKKGDTPYDWFERSYELMNDDPDEYYENGPALSGIFEVTLEGNNVTAYYGSYWWD
ncbi:MAG: SPOR domain-containing protein [Lachnospiraceae bacterium]|nr:SPOR domain-containing protein [Lachnospiraceae bacterium]